MASRAKLTARATQSRAKRLKAEMEADSCGSSAAAWAPRAASESAIALPAARKGVVREHAKSWGGRVGKYIGDVRGGGAVAECCPELTPKVRVCQS